MRRGSMYDSRTPAAVIYEDRSYQDAKVSLAQELAHAPI
jgi:hypothetical protein